MQLHSVVFADRSAVEGSGTTSGGATAVTFLATAYAIRRRMEKLLPCCSADAAKAADKHTRPPLPTLFYLATDNSNIVAEAKQIVESMPGNQVRLVTMTGELRKDAMVKYLSALSTSQAKRDGAQAAFDIVLDLFLMADSEYFIGTCSSSVSLLAGQLVRARHLRQSDAGAQHLSVTPLDHLGGFEAGSPEVTGAMCFARNVAFDKGNLAAGVIIEGIDCIECQSGGETPPPRPQGHPEHVISPKSPVPPPLENRTSAIKSSTSSILRRTIVTAASRNHYGVLLHQMLRSIFEPRLGYNNETRVIVYDLGLTTAEAKAIKHCYPAVTVRPFDFGSYPSYFNIGVAAGEYAWKPVIVEAVASELGGLVLWLDAGVIVVVDVRRAFDVVEKHGVYTPTSPGNVQKWTHPGTLRYLHVEGEERDELLTKPNRNGAIVGFNTADAASR
jgi:hypothetical protein